MAGEMQITFRLIGFKRGGFLLAEQVGSGDYEPLQAVADIDHACIVMQHRMREWHKECGDVRDFADVEPDKVIHRRFWRSIK